MKHSIKLTCAAVAMSTLALGGFARIAHASPVNPHQAIVNLLNARKIALKAHPGIITDEELENEGGGSGLRYSFDIKSGSRTYEVGVDAKTGAVLENTAEGQNPD